MRQPDPHIVATWVKGWTIARKTAPPQSYKDGFRVDVGWPQQTVRYVFPGPSPVIGELASTINEPWIFLKACASPDTIRPMLTSSWEIQRPGYLMTQTGPMWNFERSEGYTFDITRAPTSIVCARDRAREVAAIGRVVVVNDFAIYDRMRPSRSIGGAASRGP